MAKEDIEQNKRTNPVANDKIMDAEAIETRLAELKTPPRQSEIETTETDETDETDTAYQQFDGNISGRSMSKINQQTRLEESKALATNQQEKGKIEQTAKVAEEMVEQAAKQTIKKVLLQAALMAAPYVLLGLLVIIVLLPFGMVAYCVQQKGLLGNLWSFVTNFGSFEQTLSDAVTDKCFVAESGGSQAANAAATQTPKKDTSGESGANGTYSSEDAGNSPN